MMNEGTLIREIILQKILLIQPLEIPKNPPHFGQYMGKKCGVFLFIFNIK